MSPTAANLLDDPWRDLALSVHFENPEEAAHSVIRSLDGCAIERILALGDRPLRRRRTRLGRLGLLFHHPASAEACRNKLRMREVFRDAGLPTPWFRAVPLHPTQEPALLGINYPCVLKPLSLSLPVRRVVRANNREEFIAGATRLKRLLESPEIRATHERNLDQMLVEGYLPGKEVAVEGLLTEGELRTLAIFDKPGPSGRALFRGNDLHNSFATSHNVSQAIEDSFLNTVRAMGLTHGPVHAEFRVNDDGCLAA